MFDGRYAAGGSHGFGIELATLGVYLSTVERGVSPQLTSEVCTQYRLGAMHAQQIEIARIASVGLFDPRGQHALMRQRSDVQFQQMLARPEPAGRTLATISRYIACSSADNFAEGSGRCIRTSGTMTTKEAADCRPRCAWSPGGHTNVGPSLNLVRRRVPVRP